MFKPLARFAERLREWLRLRFGLRRTLCRPVFPMAVRNDPPAPFRVVKRDGFFYIEPRPRA